MDKVDVPLSSFDLVTAFVLILIIDRVVEASPVRNEPSVEILPVRVA
ncbi:hypothetical protein SDC9_70369 [bioreactor metagenome]|uniref:Uncharacterized protein n=1 Tax=bioreactor metagenome TaxID=1076179 RepID=A0A644Y5Q8_9ZZZZ